MEKKWTGNNAFQTEYYNYLKENGFVKGDVARSDKDAREKTSGLRDIVFLGEDLAMKFYEATKKLTNNKVGSAWRKYFFNTNARSVIARDGLSTLNAVPILSANSAEQFNEEFFKIMHLFKAKATLSDYLLEIAFEQSELLSYNVDLKEIGLFLDVDIDILYQKLGLILGTSVSNREMAQKVIKAERYARLNKLIDEKFDKNTLIILFHDFESRNDDEIRSIVTDNADISTIFEYVVGIAWYVISERKGDVLEYMNLSLEADLLPKTHAGGGEADIVWKYNATYLYPKHTLLIEVTLADGSNQRRMEMEPVSRHLGDYCLAHPDEEAYCVFITTYSNFPHHLVC